MEEQSMHIVIVGHVDHGKSTLVGRLFYDTKSLAPEKMDEIRRVCEDLKRPFEFAYIMDNLEEEREKGITIDIAHTFFSTEKRRYVIIDAPGHKEFLKNMISGTSQADCAILLVDVSLGIQEQTLRHCYILGLLGIAQVAVVANKMDLVGYSQDAYERIDKEIRATLAKVGVTPSYVIPVSARNGENVAIKSELMPWYSGPTVLGALDSFKTLVSGDKALRFPVQDAYDVDGARVLVGRVESGVLRSGESAVASPHNGSVTIREIRKFGEPNLESAVAGECVGVLVEGEKLGRGDVISSGALPVATKRVRANIFWMIDVAYKQGAKLTFKCATQEAVGVIEKIHRRFDPAALEVVDTGAHEITGAQVAEVDIALDRPVAIDRFSEVPELGRFVLEHQGHPVAGGIIV